MLISLLLILWGYLNLFEEKTSLGAPCTVFLFLDSERVWFGRFRWNTSGKLGRTEWRSENFFILGSEWISSVTVKVKRFSDNLGKSWVIFFKHTQYFFSFLAVFVLFYVYAILFFSLSIYSRLNYK